MSVIVTDNTEEVLSELAERIEAALEAVGNQCVSHAKQNITAAGRVDTGALRNSMTHLVKADEKVVYVGTNNEYAVFNEMGTGIHLDGGGGRQTPWRYKDSKGNWHTTSGIKPIHFLRNAGRDHQSEYKDIIQMFLEQG